MQITINITPADLVELIVRLAATVTTTIHEEFETMSGSLSDQLTAAQASAETALNDISAKVDALAGQVGAGQVSAEQVATAQRIVTLAQAVSAKLDAAAPAGA